MADPSRVGDAAVERSVLEQWAQSGVLTADQYSRSLELAGLRPGASAWTPFLERLLAAMGALLIGAGVVYFFAYNWDTLGRFGELALLDVAIAAAAAVAWWRGTAGLAGRASLWLATVLVGALLALIGQTYQTGADPYQLFLAWALLALPWTVASNWAPGWMLLLLLANLAIGQYFGDVLRPFDPFLGAADDALWLALWGINAIATIVAELLARRRLTWAVNWLIRMAAALTIAAQTAIALLVIDRGNIAERHSPVLLLATVVTLAGGLWLYRYRRLDLPILGMGAASAIVIAEALVARTLFRSRFGADALIMMALVLVLLSAAAAIWLTRLARQRRDPAEAPT